MIYACYFVPFAGAHPVASLDDYPAMWDIMKRSVNRLGHRLMHITDMHTESWGDDTFRVDVDAATTVYSRDVAWAKFVDSLPENEQATMVEPDTLMLENIPDLLPGSDLCLLKRDKGSCGWFRLCRKSSLPFYSAVVDAYEHVDRSLWGFHGDMKALETAMATPHGCSIEWRSWERYGFRKGRKPFFLQFKGTSKPQMRQAASALGICP